VNGWFSILTASALGSLHCVGMCGGLVGFYAADDAGASRIAPHATYHAMRLIAYVSLGAAAGGLGSALDVAGSRAGLGRVGVFVAALALLFWAAPRLLSRRSTGAPISLGRHAKRRALPVVWLERLFASLAGRVRRQPPTWRAGALGLASALLPCGWLYAFVMLAAGSGSAGAGAALMLAFWMGTLPALLGLAVGVSWLSVPLRARSARWSAALVLAVCAVNLAERWPLASATESAGPADHPSCHGSH
jgi:sulfite exporter TauE/SafE